MRPLFRDFKTKDWIQFTVLVGGGLITLGMMFSNAMAERASNRHDNKETRKLLYEKTATLREAISDNKTEIRENRRILYNILRQVKRK